MMTYRGDDRPERNGAEQTRKWLSGGTRDVGARAPHAYADNYVTQCFDIQQRHI